jgi:L-asparaginase/Glu-tRNA(Gln) amidotransferase subunit D
MGENSKHSRVKLFEFDGFVVLHGSDTMSYSASALSFMLENLAKPVIFTGSITDRDLRTDAKENLITAIQIALQENGLPLLLRCAFILNISCTRKQNDQDQCGTF